MRTFRPLFLAFIVSLIAVSSLRCSTIVVAFMDAQLSGETAFRARINFTDWTPIPGTTGDTRLHVRFSNADGNTMELVLTPQGGFFTPSTTYNIDGSTNTLSAHLINIVGGNSQSLDVTANAGSFFNLTTLSRDATGNITEFTGEFSLSFDVGGAAAGWVNILPE